MNTYKHQIPIYFRFLIRINQVRNKDEQLVLFSNFSLRNCSDYILNFLGGEEDFITMDSTCALSPLSSQSHGSSSFHLSRNPTSWTHALNQNTHLASGVLNNMNPLMVGSEYINSQNRLWCDEVSTVDLLHLSSQLERVELHK